ncbi:MAG: delta-aminolevulinic acid dehydratase [Muribaculaceae bacterium]|nr:delta-aminolevulinic acid dehydratase [Muribaculaceae bacterium]
MNKLLIKSLIALKDYCEKEQFKGWDPYDGLNSKVFMSLPGLKNNSFYRLAVIQLFKRSPINLRKIALVSKEYNAKGVGLFLQGYCNLHEAVMGRPELAGTFGEAQEIEKQIDALAKLLISLRSQGDYHGACWGYNFDWQNRTGFIFPKFTPTVVATTFCATALISAYEITKNQEFLDVALSSAQFVITDLNRTECNDAFLFSYSPLKGHETVYNASLLGSKLLSWCYKYTSNEEYRTLARESVLACCHGQQENGAWVYGMLPVQQWVDSFHTGYNLEALKEYEYLTGDDTFHHCLDKGFDYYIKNFFEQDGSPRYYDNKKYPIDIHCPAQLFVTLAKMNKFQEYKLISEKVLKWTVDNMQSSNGYFYYQLKKGINSKISYMRWSNAFMFYALTYYLIDE